MPGIGVERVDPDTESELDADGDKSVSSQMKDSRWSLITRVVTAAGMIVNLAIMTTQLGADDFGRYAGVAALAAILAGLTRFGASERMLEQVMEDTDHIRKAWGRAIGSTILAMIVCVGFMVALKPILLPSIAVSFVAVLAIGEFMYVTSNDINQRLLHSVGRFRRAAFLIMSVMSIRVLAVSTLIFFPISNLTDLAFRYLASGAAAWCLGVLVTWPWHGWTMPTFPSSVAEVKQGLSIAVGQTSLTISTRIDQTLLLRAGFISDTAIYSLGARAVFNAMLPANALMEVSYPEFFRAGAKGGVRVRTLAKKLAKPLIGYGFFAAFVLIVLGPAVEMLLDDSFTGVGWVIIAMSGFPVLRIAQNLVGDMLTGLGEHTARSRAAVGASVGNIALNLVLIPRMGWQGAAISTYLAEGFLLLALIASVHHYEDPDLVI